jgi:leader peptidase (prepilin peptidase) / N-methyltransferase
MYFDPSSHVWSVMAFLIGAAIGSFLNVVIYRLPLGMSVNEPARSFCPSCRSPIPAHRNIPLLSWLVLRGKCPDCGVRIPFRYFFVELITALLFLASWLQHPPTTAGIFFVMMAIIVAVTWIDADHFIIPLRLTTGGSVFALCASFVQPNSLRLQGDQADDAVWWQAPSEAFLGWVLGFFLLWSVVLFGKMVFGKKRVVFDEPTAWHLQDSTETEPVSFHIDGETMTWDDLFYRKSDELLLECTEIHLNGEKIESGALKIRESMVTTPSGKEFALENVQSLRGTAQRAVIPREAMGMGDPHLLGMIGAFLGGQAAIFTVAASAFYALAAALLGRVGFGKPLPFGPFLSLGAVTWVFGGWRLWQWYYESFLSWA